MSYKWTWTWSKKKNQLDCTAKRIYNYGQGQEHQREHRLAVAWLMTRTCKTCVSSGSVMLSVGRTLLVCCYSLKYPFAMLQLIWLGSFGSDNCFMTNTSAGKVHIESNVSLLQNLLQMRWLEYSDLLCWIRCVVWQLFVNVKSICTLIKSHSTFVSPCQLSAGDQSGKSGKQAVLYVVCRTYDICCGNGTTIWLTAVWTTHKRG